MASSLGSLIYQHVDRLVTSKGLTSSSTDLYQPFPVMNTYNFTFNIHWFVNGYYEVHHVGILNYTFEGQGYTQFHLQIEEYNTIVIAKLTFT